jgi:transcriptional regulator with XRE-family HTH domain
MEAQEPTAAPRQFIRRLKSAMNGQGLSLRRLAEKTGVSPAYLSRLFNQERGLPADETIARFEEVLDIPRGALFDAAGRHDQELAKFFRKDSGRLLMRTVAPLTAEELAEVQKIAERFANRHTKDFK